METFIVIAIILFLAVIAFIVVFSAIDEASKQRQGAKSGTAMIVSILFTPVAGFLYLLCFPEKKEEEKNS